MVELTARTDPSEEDGPALRKCVFEPALRAADVGQQHAPGAAAKFAPSQRVLVRRSDGRQSAGVVAEYDPSKRLYKVELDGAHGCTSAADDERVFKRAYEHMLVAAESAADERERCASDRDRATRPTGPPRLGRGERAVSGEGLGRPCRRRGHGAA